MNKLFVPARIMDRQWAEKFVEGQIFMRSLTGFGAWEAVKHSDDPTLNNTFRGDLREGSVKNIANPEDDRLFRAFPQDLKQVIKGGAVLDVGDIQYFNTLCLCCIDYLSPLNRFVPPSYKMKEFGDTAVIIKDMNEFLRRFMIGLEKCWPNVCLLLDRVEYYSQDKTRLLNPLFNKPNSYRDQNELRLAVGRLDMSRPTSNGKHELYQSTEPLKFEIGNIADITQIMPIDDFCTLNHMEPVILPMMDLRSDIFNSIVKETRERMRQFESRQQTIIFSI